jgi:small subunit ribosomal protein S17
MADPSDEQTTEVSEQDTQSQSEATETGSTGPGHRRRARAKQPKRAVALTPEERQSERTVARRDKAARRRVRRQAEKAKAAEARAAAGPVEELAPVHAPVEGSRRVRQGIVVSAKPDKTITVRIDIARRHLRYKKIVRASSTLHAHDEGNEAHEGDVVRVIESRPLSATKRWRLIEVLERAR